MCPPTFLQDVWPEVLRCISRFELVSQSGPSDMAIFSQPGPEAASPSGLAKMRRGFFGSAKPTKQEGTLLLGLRTMGKSFLVACIQVSIMHSPCYTLY